MSQGLNIEDRRKFLSLGDGPTQRKPEQLNKHLTFHVDSLVIQPTISANSQLIIEKLQAQKEQEVMRTCEDPNSSFEMHEAHLNLDKTFYTSQNRTREVVAPNTDI